MIKVCLSILLSFFCIHLAAQKTVVTHLQCEYKQNPIGIDEEKPALSWQLSTAAGAITCRGVVQTAYRIIVADDPVVLHRDTGNVWDSQKVFSDQSIRVLYAGIKMQSATAYYWNVMVWDNKGNVSHWSSAGHRLTQLLSGRWISGQSRWAM